VQNKTPCFSFLFGLFIVGFGFVSERGKHFLVRFPVCGKPVVEPLVHLQHGLVFVCFEDLLQEVVHGWVLLRLLFFLATKVGVRVEQFGQLVDDEAPKISVLARPKQGCPISLGQLAETGQVNVGGNVLRVRVVQSSGRDVHGRGFGVRFGKPNQVVHIGDLRAVWMLGLKVLLKVFQHHEFLVADGAGSPVSVEVGVLKVRLERFPGSGLFLAALDNAAKGKPLAQRSVRRNGVRFPGKAPGRRARCP
jgi:hypothetical protein